MCYEGGCGAVPPACRYWCRHFLARRGMMRHGQAAGGGGRGRPTASGSGRCLPETSSRGSEDAGNGRRAERSAAE